MYINVISLTLYVAGLLTAVARGVVVGLRGVPHLVFWWQTVVR
jgi:hypothetical protein